MVQYIWTSLCELLISHPEGHSVEAIRAARVAERISVLDSPGPPWTSVAHCCWCVRAGRRPAVPCTGLPRSLDVLYAARRPPPRPGFAAVTTAFAAARRAADVKLAITPPAAYGTGGAGPRLSLLLPEEAPVWGLNRRAVARSRRAPSGAHRWPTRILSHGTGVEDLHRQIAARLWRCRDMRNTHCERCGLSGRKGGAGITWSDHRKN